MKTWKSVLEEGWEVEKRDVEALIAHLFPSLGPSIFWEKGAFLSSQEEEALREGLERLQGGEPFEYLVGRVPFFGVTLEVGPGVFIPRPETEILVAHVVERFRGGRLVDLCAGSGAIGLSCKRAKPAWVVSLVELSPDAAVFLRKNQVQNGLDVEVLEGDFLQALGERSVEGVVCNPPYLSHQDLAVVAPSVRDFEPHMALVGGEDGLEFYRRLSEELPKNLVAGGQLFLEIGKDQKEAVQKIFSTPFWGPSQVLLDWAGKDRFFFVERQ